jgi:hypothetical protein
MPLDSTLDLVGDPNIVKVSASDISGTHECGRFLGLKTRPTVKVIDGWQKLFPQGDRAPFPLGDIVDLLVEADKCDFATYEAQSAWLTEAINRRRVHRLVRTYVTLAVENILEAHESIEAEVGRLLLLVADPVVGPPNRRLTAWAPLYTTEDGIREIRRFRLGSAKADEESVRWASVAAYVTAEYRGGPPPHRVRVIEIGAVDGSLKVLFDGTATEARSQFLASGRDLARAVAEDDHVVACHSCGDCKTAGSCRTLVSVDGVLRQPGRGYSSRSVSAKDLEQYALCPAQWLLNSELHLPSDSDGGGGSARGLAVHKWLRAAHARGVPCTDVDLPQPGNGLGPGEGILTEGEYEAAYPFLGHHLRQCPLGSDGVLVLADENVYGYDHHAEVVPVIRPDLMYKVGNRLVIREIKTAEQSYEEGRDDAYDRFLQVPFGIMMLKAGLMRLHGATSATMEIELLTRAQPFVWAWEVDNPAVANVAAGDVGRAVNDWHVDHTWATRPGPHCAWCPVRRWCPDSDAWDYQTPARADLAIVGTISDQNSGEAPF